MVMKLLVVDDEAPILELFKRFLEPLGYEVSTFSDSREAARRVEAEKFDGVVLDAMMPNLDGFELAERIRTSRSNSNVPIVMITGYDSLKMMRQGFQAGITFFLNKPVTPENLRGLFKAARGTMLEERRRYARLPLKTPVRCHSAGKRFETQSVDLARGGIRLPGANGMDAGQIIELEFSLPGARQALKLMGKVVRSDAPNLAAVEFIDPENHDKEALERFIAAGTEE